MKGLTLKLEPKVDHPYANCDRCDQLVPVPNGNASGAHEQIEMPRGRRSFRTKAENDALAEDDQERSRSKGQAPKELQRKGEGEENKVPMSGHSSDCGHWGVLYPGLSCYCRTIQLPYSTYSTYSSYSTVHLPS